MNPKYLRFFMLRRKLGLYVDKGFISLKEYKLTEFIDLITRYKSVCTSLSIPVNEPHLYQ